MSTSPVPYEAAVACMEARVEAIARGDAPELVWLTEHPPVVTLGTSARIEDVCEPERFPVHRTGRGGQATYHGPGQRIAYVMIDVRHRLGGDVRRLVSLIEDVALETLAGLGVLAERRSGHPGLYVPAPGGGATRYAKIAALGLRVRHGISFHGLAMNVAPDLDDFRAVVGCGEPAVAATSLAALGAAASFKDVDNLLLAAFASRLGPIAPAAPPCDTP